MDDKSSELRKLPQVDRLVAKLGPQGSHKMATGAARAAIDEARSSVSNGGAPPSEIELVERALELLNLGERRRLIRVVNATGVLLHTNLGRAPLGDEAIAAMRNIGSGYSNLEYDLENRTRGSRYAHASALLVTLTGAEDALVVNNNAAAVLLAAGSIARGGEVVVSRGELIEIGGGFRIPEIIATSGAVLKEVGTTNRTHPADYERAIGDSTAAIMKVHPSNYRVTGFVSSVDAPDLAGLAHRHSLPLIYDLGSGLFSHRVGGIEQSWLLGEPAVDQALTAGADIVTFSADKLMGGPQAGIILGRADLLAGMRASPLLRAFRVDKTTLAALESTLIIYLEGREAGLPLWKMALTPISEIDRRAARLCRALELSGAGIQCAGGLSTTGGGSLPGGTIPTVVLQIGPSNQNSRDLAARLLESDPPVVARIDDDHVVLDLRTVDPSDDAYLEASLQKLLE